MNNKTSRKQLDQEFDRTEMIDLANTTRWVIHSAAGILLLFFGWLKFRGVEWTSVARDIPADLIFKGAMSLYFLCWVAGTLSDTRDQEKVYIYAPNKGSIPTWWMGRRRSFDSCLRHNVLG